MDGAACVCILLSLLCVVCLCVTMCFYIPFSLWSPGDWQDYYISTQFYARIFSTHSFFLLLSFHNYILWANAQKFNHVRESLLQNNTGCFLRRWALHLWALLFINVGLGSQVLCYYLYNIGINPTIYPIRLTSIFIIILVFLDIHRSPVWVMQKHRKPHTAMVTVKLT